MFGDMFHKSHSIIKVKVCDTLCALKAPTELTDEHWISSSKPSAISQEQLKKQIQPTLCKELTPVQKQKLQVFELKYLILFQKKMVLLL